MNHPLLLLLPVVLAATRSLVSGVQTPDNSKLLPTISAEAECEVLFVIIFCLAGLLISLYLMTKFPDLGATITEMNEF